MERNWSNNCDKGSHLLDVWTSFSHEFEEGDSSINKQKWRFIVTSDQQKVPKLRLVDKYKHLSTGSLRIGKNWTRFCDLENFECAYQNVHNVFELKIGFGWYTGIYSVCVFFYKDFASNWYPSLQVGSLQRVFELWRFVGMITSAVEFRVRV